MKNLGLFYLFKVAVVRWHLKHKLSTYDKRQPSMQESKVSHEEGHVSESSKYHMSHRHGHNERVERHEGIGRKGMNLGGMN
ncbi:hypothetical protein CR513_29167, partial [Mucuna pruriens]